MRMPTKLWQWPHLVGLVLVLAFMAWSVFGGDDRPGEGPPAEYTPAVQVASLSTVWLDTSPELRDAICANPVTYAAKLTVAGFDYPVVYEWTTQRCRREGRGVGG